VQAFGGAVKVPASRDFDKGPYVIDIHRQTPA
jgi:hypothetical protein